MSKLRHVSIVVLLTLHLSSMLAFEVPGYIITNNSDTIKGDIKLSNFDIYTGGLLLNGINLEQFHSTLHFRATTNSGFKRFTAKDISGYSFNYKSIRYCFKTFMIESNSIVKSERKKLRFLNLIHQGEIAVYRDIVRKNNYFITNNPNSKVIDYSDYYLLDTKHGLTKFSGTNEYKTLIDLLRNYEIDQKFLEQLPTTVRIRDVIEILNAYESWRKNSPISAI